MSRICRIYSVLRAITCILKICFIRVQLKTSEEAVAQMEAKRNVTYVPVVMNVYESDGVTVIDTFTEGSKPKR